jgi:hypothetical protein
MVLANFAIAKRHELVRPQAAIAPDLQEVIAWTRQHVDAGRFVTVPAKLSFLIAPSWSDAHNDAHHRVYYRFIQRPGEIGFRHFEDDMGGPAPSRGGWSPSFEVPSQTPSTFAERYGATHMIVDKRYLAGLERHWDGRNAGGSLRVVFENDSFVALAIEPAATRRSAIAA